ncbi:Os01g0880350, partial [Oryza sativa Japonica Group]
PLVTLYEAGDAVHVDVVPGHLAAPPDPAPAGAVAAGAGALVLAVVERLEREVAVPRHPPARLHDLGERAADVHRARVLLPGPAQVDVVHVGLLPVQRHVVVAAVDDAAAEHDPRGLRRVGAPLRGDGVVLALLRAELPREDDEGGVAEDGGRVAEDEVDGARDAAPGVELPHGVRVQRVLVAQELHRVQHRAVARRPERHRLVRVGPGRVGDRQVARHEAVREHAWKQIRD